MPGRRRKGFKTFRDVAKLGATHFEVGHRSQKDPMLADSEASEHVLVPKELGTREKLWEEQQKYGIYYEDDYDYLQHLRDVQEIHDSEMHQLPGFQMKEDDTVSVSMASSTASRLTLPSSALGSTLERDIGLLGMQAESREDWDPEIMAALDDSFDFDNPDNALDDDFIQMANAEADTIDEEEEGDLADVSSQKDDEDNDKETDGGEETESAEEEVVEQCSEKVKSLSEWIKRIELEGAFDDGEDEDEGGSDGASGGFGSDNDEMECSIGMTGQKFPVSKYSAAMNPRNKNLQLIDQMHEALLKREYSEDQRGALDGEKLGGRGTFDSERWKQMENAFFESQEMLTMKDLFNSKDRVRPVLSEKYYYVEEKDYSVEEEINCSQQPLATTTKPEYDIETIRTTYPKNRFCAAQIEIPEHMLPQKSKKKQVVDGEEETESDTVSVSSHLPGLTLKDLDRQLRMERLADAPSSFRPKDETPEERKERKKMVKEKQKERRVEKTLNKAAFRIEIQRQKKQKESGVNQKRIISMSPYL